MLEDNLSRIEILEKNPKSGCYFLFNKGEVVYVGISADISHRIINHSKTKEFDEVKYLNEPNYIRANLIESYYIDELNPLYNKKPGVYGKTAKAFNLNITQGSGWDSTKLDETEFKSYKIPKLDELLNLKIYKGVLLLVRNNEPFLVGCSANIFGYLHSREVIKYRKITEEVWVIEENDYLTALKIADSLFKHFKPKYSKTSTYATHKLRWGDKFDETTIPYPSTWK